MTAFEHPLNSLRRTVEEIGLAVTASRDLSRAASRRLAREAQPTGSSARKP